MTERKEALIRILIGIISGIIIGIWGSLVKFLAFLNWIMVLITQKRNKGIAEFCEIWNTQAYTFLRYMTFVTNKRPFPFNQLKKNLTKFE